MTAAPTAPTRAILTLPDPLLRQPCAPVERFDAALAALAHEMLAAMYAAPGRGLAAPQIGVLQRVFVMDVGWKEGAPEPRALVNPVVVEASQETATGEEACLSIPDRTSRVTRPARVRLRWQDLQGRPEERDFEGFAAVCVQHEMDHLDGVLCIDREEPGAP